MDPNRERELVEVRRRIHANPELSREEFATSRLVFERLSKAGLRPRLLTGDRGVVCDVGGGPGPVVALRADLDALPVEDAKSVPYRSTNPGVCHSCGHDVHTTVLVGAGLELADGPDLPGTVRLIFQPAEEAVPSGSLDAIADGVLKDVDVIYALHCDPTADVGKVGVRAGPITAAIDAITVRFHGPGGHSARPHKTDDLIYIAARVITELPQTLGRLLPTPSQALVTFGALNAGVAHNTIPSYAEARGTVRTHDRDIWTEMPRLVEKVIEGIVLPFGITWDLEYNRVCPAVSNDERATSVLAAAITETLGEYSLFETHVSMGGEDFAWYLDHVPGSLARLGIRASDSTQQYDLHSGLFDVDERCIPLGATLMARLARLALTEYAVQPTEDAVPTPHLQIQR